MSEENITDHWEAFDTLEESKEKYEKIINEDNTYSVSIVTPIRSTDYDNSQYLVLWSKYPAKEVES